MLYSDFPAELGGRVIFWQIAPGLTKLLLEAKLIVITLKNFRSECAWFDTLRLFIYGSRKCCCAIAMDLIVGGLRKKHSVIEIHSFLFRCLNFDGSTCECLFFRRRGDEIRADSYRG